MLMCHDGYGFLQHLGFEEFRWLTGSPKPCAGMQTGAMTCVYYAGALAKSVCNISANLPIHGPVYMDTENLERALTEHYHNGSLYATLGYSPRQGSEPSEIWRPGPMLHDACPPCRTRVYAS